MCGFNGTQNHVYIMLCASDIVVLHFAVLMISLILTSVVTWYSWCITSLSIWLFCDKKNQCSALLALNEDLMNYSHKGTSNAEHISITWRHHAFTTDSLVNSWNVYQVPFMNMCKSIVGETKRPQQPTNGMYLEAFWGVVYILYTFVLCVLTHHFTHNIFTF